MNRRGTQSESVPTRRAVILGASNVIRGITTVVRSAQAAAGEPLDLMLACGHGRSYGITSSVLGRGLPGIVPCGIWPAIDSRPKLPTTALLTDIGNDLLYNATVDQIIAWIETCCERLTLNCERIVITELPLASLATLDERRFLLMRMILFPKSQLRFASAMRSAEQLNERLATVAQRFGARLVAPSLDWYGFDPIHIRTRFHGEAWARFIRAWADEELSPVDPGHWNTWLRLRRLRPETRTLFGIRQSQEQPAAILPDGTWLSFY